jgi:hypothetical protein
MGDRFEMPVEVPDINLFAVDDFLRAIRVPEGRRKIVREQGYTEELRRRYEKENSLPYGAVELAMMADDPRVAEMNKLLAERLPDLKDRGVPAKVINDFYEHVGSMALGLQKVYPEATNFLMQYALLSERNRSAFAGDYRFSNEYKLMFVQDGGNNSPFVNVNVAVNVNLGAAINVGAAVNVVVVALLVAAAAVLVWVWVALYGPRELPGNSL